MPFSAWTKVTDREIERLQKNAAVGRRICQRLLNAPSDAISDTAEPILQGLLDRRWLETWSYDRARVVLEIRREAMFVTKTREGESIQHLISVCYQGRDDLNEFDTEWIEDLYVRERVAVRMRHVGRLKRCFVRVGREAA